MYRAIEFLSELIHSCLNPDILFSFDATMFVKAKYPAIKAANIAPKRTKAFFSITASNLRSP
jgi:hypothetical protein